MVGTNKCNMVLIALVCAVTGCANRISPNINSMDCPIVNAQRTILEAELKVWPHEDICKDSIPGLSLAGAYEALKRKRSQTLIVGIIDSGIDIEHEDLKEVIWQNSGETANNSIDDDRNGYVDDIHGWNFLGSRATDIYETQMEITRIVKKFMNRFD